MNIDIFTCLAPNSAPYADALQKNLTTLQSGKHNLRFWALISHHDVETCGLPQRWTIVPIDTDKVVPVGVSKPSVNHAKLLNQIVSHIPKDSNMVIITDCDMFVYRHDWDDYLYRQMATNDIDCIGTEKHDSSLRMFFIAFPVNTYRELKPNFMPGVDEKYVSGWATNMMGLRLVADTGWRLEELLHENKKKYRKLRMVMNDYYDYDGKLFCSHLGGSHKKDFKSAEVKAWYKECKQKIY